MYWRFWKGFAEKKIPFKMCIIHLGHSSFIFEKKSDTKMSLEKKERKEGRTVDRKAGR